MRLIDADSITEKIMNVFEEALRIALKSGTFDLEGVMLKIKCYLDNQPTAFDIDKVVKKLKHSQYMLLEEVKNATSYSHEEELIENIRHYEYAINIVKAGGIDERNT